MKYTGNYNLKKPEGSDVVNIEDFNENADIIDAELKKLNDAIKDLDADGITLPDGKTISEKFTEITTEIGNTEELDTETKLSLVAAINEINQALVAHKADIATETKYGHIRLSDIPTPSIVPKSEGIRVLTSDPVNPEEGEMWINSTERVMKIFLGGKTQTTNIVSEVYLLNSGYENVAWVEGRTYSGGIFEKHSGYLLISSPKGTGGYAAAVTDNPVNLESVKKIVIDWELIERGIEPGYGPFLIVSTEKDAVHHTYDARVSDRDIGRKTTALEVGALNGSYYIRAHTYDVLDYAMTIKVYSVWLVY